jgi:rare lipoprotein A
MKKAFLFTAIAVLLTLPNGARAQAVSCADEIKIPARDTDDFVSCDQQPPQPSPLQIRVLKYAAVALEHKVAGLASYYSTSLDGTLTATGEIFRNRRFTAAHLTLPLGTWIEVTARATGRKIRCRVNDRGPYAKKFFLDLSQAAARALGVDVAEDRHVDIRIIGLPREQPLPENWETALNETPAAVEAVSSGTR